MVVVVPFLNEAWCLPTFLASMARQHRLPDRLVLVDDGSTDESAGIAAEFATTNEYAVLLRRPTRPAAADRLAGAPEYRAFLWAVEQTPRDWDVVAKMDADLDLPRRAIETVAEALARDPGLGMAGLRLAEVAPDGRHVPLSSPPDHVEGATKFYRRDCWDDIAPVAPILGWDTLDELDARRHGWRTQTFAAPDGDPLHLRRMGTHGKILRSFRRWGACSYGYGAHPVHVAYYALKLMGTRRPRLIGGLNYLAGWAVAAVQRAPRAEPALRRAVRHEQLAKARRRLPFPPRRPVTPATDRGDHAVR
jgi:glycosyltransferase involved in cell wall biosynthesis